MKPKFLPFTLFLLVLPAIAGADAIHPKGKERPKRTPAVKLPPAPPKLPTGKSLTLSLDEAYDRTLATDQSIRVAWYGIRKANLRPWSALARMGPSLTGSAGYQVNERYNTAPQVLMDGGSTYVTTRNDAHTRNLGFTLVQPLFDPTVAPAYRQGKVVAQSARLQYRYTIREVLFGVAQAYYNVLKLESVAEVNRMTVELAEAQLIQAEARFEVGEVARVDVLRAKASMEEARNALIQSQGQLDINRNTLSNILNLGGRTDFKLTEPRPAIDSEIALDQAVGNAFASREDFQIKRNDVKVERLRRDEIRAGYAPKISAQASTQWTNISGNGTGESQVNMAGVSISMPFLTGGQREIDLKEAGYNIAQSEINVESAGKVVESDVQNAWVAVRTGREALDALKAAVEAAEANYSDVQSFYELGESTSLDVQVALRELNNTRTLLASQIYDYQIALRDLERAQAAFQPTRVNRKAATR